MKQQKYVLQRETSYLKQAMCHRLTNHHSLKTHLCQTYKSIRILMMMPVTTRITAMYPKGKKYRKQQMFLTQIELHFGKQTGFVEFDRNTEFDLFIEYVKSIKEKTSEQEERKWYNPHPKWLEFRNRVDAAELNNDRRWELHEVFKEEAKRNSLMNQYQGIHYKDGLGMKLMTEHSE